MEPLTAYEIDRTPLTPVREELRCMICFEILQEPTAVAECLHRFCKGCAAQAVRKFAAVETDTRAALHSRRKQSGGAECPLCRKNIASRRDLYEDGRFQAMVSAILPYVAAEEAAEQRALEARTQQYKNALLAHQQRSGGGGGGSASSSSPTRRATAAAEKEEMEEGKEEAAADDEEEEPPMDPQTAALQIAFGLRPLPPSTAADTAVGAARAGAKQRRSSLALPPVGEGRLFRTTAGAKVSAIKRLLARRLSLPRPGLLDLCLLFSPNTPFPPSDDDDTRKGGGEGDHDEDEEEEGGGETVVVLDEALTLADVVSEVWPAVGDVGRELVFYYGLREGAEGEEEEQEG